MSLGKLQLEAQLYDARAKARQLGAEGEEQVSIVASAIVFQEVQEYQKQAAMNTHRINQLVREGIKHNG